MDKERRVFGKSVWRGAALSLGSYLLLLLLVSYLTVSGCVGETMMPQCVWLCAGLASLLGAASAMRGAGKGSVVPVLLSTAAFCASVLILGFLASNTFSLSSATALLAAAAAGALPVVLLTGRRGKRTKRHKSPRSRR